MHLAVIFAAILLASMAVMQSDATGVYLPPQKRRTSNKDGTKNSHEKAKPRRLITVPTGPPPPPRRTPTITIVQQKSISPKIIASFALPDSTDLLTFIPAVFAGDHLRLWITQHLRHFETLCHPPDVLVPTTFEFDKKTKMGSVHDFTIPEAYGQQIVLPLRVPFSPPILACINAHGGPAETFSEKQWRLEMKGDVNVFDRVTGIVKLSHTMNVTVVLKAIEVAGKPNDVRLEKFGDVYLPEDERIFYTK